MSLEKRFEKFQMVDADVGNQMLIGEHSLRSRRYDQLCWRISQNSRFQEKNLQTSTSRFEVVYEFSRTQIAFDEIPTIFI